MVHNQFMEFTDTRSIEARAQKGIKAGCLYIAENNSIHTELC